MFPNKFAILASILGGQNIPQVSENDFNNFKNGVYFVALGSSAQNAPGSYSEYRGYVRSLLGSYCVQFYYDVQQHTLFVRDKTSSWSAWRQIAIS